MFSLPWRFSSHRSRFPEAPGPACVRRRRRENPRSSTTRGIRRRSAMDGGRTGTSSGRARRFCRPVTTRAADSTRPRTRRSWRRRCARLPPPASPPSSSRGGEQDPPRTDRLALVVQAAELNGLEVAIHLEPYHGRSPARAAADIERLSHTGISDFYVYDADRAPAAEWAEALSALEGCARSATRPLWDARKRRGSTASTRTTSSPGPAPRSAASAHRLTSPASCVRRRSGRATTPAWRRATGS